MSDTKRIDAIDIFRGMAVMGFIIWHAFNLFYMGDQYKSSFFRAAILTRVAFVMVAALVIGLRNWSDYRLSNHLRRSLKIMAYPITIGIAKAVYLQSLQPISEMLIYPLWGTGHFTFSILIAIGCLYILLPLILKQKNVQIAFTIAAVAMMVLEFGKIVSMPEFWQFMCISMVFATFGKYLTHYSEFGYGAISLGLLLLSIGLFCALIVNEDIYWTIRNYAFLQALLLLIVFLGLTLNMKLLRNATPLKNLFMIFGKNSFFIYIGHYVLYVIIGVVMGFHKLEVAGIFITAVITVSVFVSICRFFPKQLIVINKIFF